MTTFCRRSGGPLRRREKLGTHFSLVPTQLPTHVVQDGQPAIEPLVASLSVQSPLALGERRHANGRPLRHLTGRVPQLL